MEVHYGRTLSTYVISIDYKMHQYVRVQFDMEIALFREPIVALQLQNGTLKVVAHSQMGKCTTIKLPKQLEIVYRNMSVPVRINARTVDVLLSAATRFIKE